jgi:hypothetical protein
MPRSKKRSQVQVLKKFKNKCMQVMEEAAKNDRYSCVVSLQPFEMGFSLQYDLEEISDRICRWLRRKGFVAEAEEDNALRINISWLPDEMRERECQAQASQTPQPTPLGPVASYYQQPAQFGNQHPWFSWIGQQPAVGAGNPANTTPAAGRLPWVAPLPQTPRVKKATK